MKMYHATHAENAESIQRQGLQPSRATGKLKTCWLHTRGKRHWAALHVAHRHGWLIEDVVILTIEVRPKQLRNTAHKGLKHCPTGTPTGSVCGVQTVAGLLDEGRIVEEEADAIHAAADEVQSARG